MDIDRLIDKALILVKTLRRCLRRAGEANLERDANLFTAKLAASKNELSVYQALLAVVGTTLLPRAAHVLHQTTEGPVLIAGDPFPPSEYPCGTTVAVSYQATCFGHLVLRSKRDGRPYNDADHELLMRFCRQAALALAHCRLAEQCGQQQRDLEREREVIAREIHDGLGAALTNISFLCRAFDEHAAESSQQTRRIVGSIQGVAQQAKTVLYISLWSLENEQKTCRDLFELLRSTVFAPAIEAGQLKLHIHDQVPPATAILNPAVRMHLVRVVQEVVQNILKHAQAKQVTCNTGLMGAWMTIMIEDDGVGFCVEERKSGHYGLFNIRKRMREIDGLAVIESTPGNGTRVTLRVPLGGTIPYSWDRPASDNPYSELQAEEHGLVRLLAATEPAACPVSPTHSPNVHGCSWLPKMRRIPIAYERTARHGK